MGSEDDRCREAERARRIDEAFRRGDLDGLRAAVDDPSVVPNGRMPETIGSCLTYAIYHSPMSFIRTLLELGADPDGPAEDGFPPLIAALSRTREHPGAPARGDVVEIVRLLLAHGAAPDVRGVNDYTPLHMAVAVHWSTACSTVSRGCASAGCAGWRSRLISRTATAACRTSFHPAPR